MTANLFAEMSIKEFNPRTPNLKDSFALFSGSSSSQPGLGPGHPLMPPSTDEGFAEANF